ncbi:antibiotic biosynthesis monooxygenase family protein [Chloroflexota bacterium]
MIRVIIRRQVNKKEEIPILIRELRRAAIGFPGYVSGETLVSTEDSYIVTVISTWQNIADWKKWDVSEQRQKILKKIEPYLSAPPLIDTYELMSTEEMEYLENPFGWLVTKEHSSFDG